MDTAQAEWLDWGRGENQAKTGWWVADVNINPFNSDEVMYGTGATIYFHPEYDEDRHRAGDHCL